MSIKENIYNIKNTIAEAQRKSPQPAAPVTLVAVTKTRSAEELAALLASDVAIFGENRIQELENKYAQLADQGCTWHLIGHLQSNKIKNILGKVALIHSLDSLGLAEKIEAQAKRADQVVDCLLQVNLVQEESKYGVAKDEVIPFLEQMARFSHLQIKGFMFMAPNFQDKEETRPLFREMYQLFTTVSALSLPNVDMKHLSMGMSDDYHIAIEEGANMVRVGSALFK